MEEISRENAGCRRHDMVAETWLRASPTRNGRCLEVRNASRNMVARKSQAKSPRSGDIRGHRKVLLRKYWAESPLSEGTAKFPIVLETNRKLFLRKYLAESEFPMRAPLGPYNIIRGGRCIGNSQVGIKSNIVLGPRGLTGSCQINAALCAVGTF